jgi:hypothetical protein
MGLPMAKAETNTTIPPPHNRRAARMRGESLYQTGLTYLRGVIQGKFEGEAHGAIGKRFRRKAAKLLRFHDSLSQKRIERIKVWLGYRKFNSTGNALSALKTRKRDKL